MGLESSRERETKKLMSDLSSRKFDIMGHQLKYKPLDLGQLDIRTDLAYEGAIRNLQDLLQGQKMEDLRAVAQRLQSQNVAGGAREALMQRLASQYAGHTQRGLSQLLNLQASQKIENLMKANQSQMAYEQLLMNLLGKKADVDLSRFGLQGNMLQHLDDTTLFDDLLALASTVGGFVIGGKKAGLF